ncbi:hypothetical protein JOC78_001005 [Bacillus ectoiniformans]|uniref:hypothetical protein n=1 Tax=Bacillus ectoiniformans TaxID=1494429 RepID=UPI0019570EB6|nr:hypothetical protein [Bacillus ectoiniformans]MBM7648065.1 hypothetical protein [Bacillus ectoiniformans]
MKPYTQGIDTAKLLSQSFESTDRKGYERFTAHESNLVCSEDLFEKSLYAMVDDTLRGN